MWRSRVLYLILVVLLMLPTITPGTSNKTDAEGSNAQSSTHLRTSVIGSGGYPTASTQYSSNSTLGQPSVIGKATGSGKVAYLGFWKGGWQSMVTEAEVIPVYRDELFQNYPNPFNPVTTIEYSVAQEGYVELKIFNVQGQLIRTLMSESKLPGQYQVSWNGRNERGRSVTTGVYFYRLQVGSFVSVKKMLLLR